ncbi:hypothetical protein [Modestobacter roseus]|uniref:Uncharacterized protein n=1 Tax=Modestobacter roseus TaxID=1181884 RepID=A0A562IP35_9ACTN|nr:hypothetical protein [Modestobacter roseus]TWH72688.1 hypothetical protein JD78_01210 [Modestobacter roseus]
MPRSVVLSPSALAFAVAGRADAVRRRAAVVLRPDPAAWDGEARVDLATSVPVG